MFNNWNFEEPRQFWTLFPHTPDNSFLGFVVEAPIVESVNKTKKNQGLIYGKEAWYSYGKESYINTIGEILELHATFKVSNIVRCSRSENRPVRLNISNSRYGRPPCLH